MSVRRHGVLLPFFALVLASCSDGFDREAALAVEARALAAIGEGRPDEAESLARESANVGGPAFAPRRDFVLGTIAFVRSEAAERQSKEPGADPTTLEFAIVRAEDAIAAWRKAAASRDDWPQARHNVERGLLLADRLRKTRAEKDKKPNPKPDTSPKPPDVKPPPKPDLNPLPPPPPPPPKPPDVNEPVKTAPDDATPDLTPEALARLLDRLKEQERQKLEKRAAVRRERTATVEKDW